MGLREMLGIGRTNVVGVVTKVSQGRKGYYPPEDVTVMEVDPIYPYNVKPRYCGVFGKKPVRVGSLIFYTVGPRFCNDFANGMIYETALQAKLISGPFNPQDLRTNLSVLSD
jgi:hypothetical protein